VWRLASGSGSSGPAPSHDKDEEIRSNTNESIKQTDHDRSASHHLVAATRYRATDRSAFDHLAAEPAHRLQNHTTGRPIKKI
jgi:hypothetical protein